MTNPANAAVLPQLTEAEPAQSAAPPAGLPDYLTQTYTWAYLRPMSIRCLDHPWVVKAILFGQYTRLLRATLAQLRPGSRVLQPACVYGRFSTQLAAHIGHKGQLNISDIAPLQIVNVRRKLSAETPTQTRIADAATVSDGPYEAICCFFLLHEVPARMKTRIINNLLEQLAPRGKLILVDYHRPRPWHPLGPLIRLVFALLEPFARELWQRDLRSYARQPERYTWTQRTFFGGLYQLVTAQAKADR